MGSASATCEIEEVNDDLDLADHSRRLNPIKVKRKGKEVTGKYILPTSARCSMEEELNQLIETIDRNSKGLRSSHPLATMSKNFQKRPIGVGMSRSPGIGICEGATLKQALRGLCISHASEMAAMKRLSKSGSSSRNSEAGTIKRLYRAVILENSLHGPVSGGEDKCSVVEVSLISDRNMKHLTEDISSNLVEQDTEQSGANAGTSYLSTAKSIALPHSGKSGKNSRAFHHPADSLISGGSEMEKLSPIRDISSCEKSVCNLPESLSLDTFPTIDGAPKSFLTSTRGFNTCSSPRKSPTRPRTVQSYLKSPDYVKKKMNRMLESASTRSSSCTGADKKAATCGTHKVHKFHGIDKHTRNETASPVNNLKSSKAEMSSNTGDVVIAAVSNTVDDLRSSDKVIIKPAEKFNQIEKIEYSHSSMSSLGDCSSSTSISDESSSSGAYSTGTRPHMSKNLRWEAIHQIETQHGDIGISNFKLLKKLGCGDIGTVYLAQLTGTTYLFALKVMDNNFLMAKKKISRVQTEQSILKMLDHPFLPTLYAHFITEKLSCLAMEYCPGGDLHVLRQKQPGRHFSEQAVRFYAAEVLLALEYLHMLGIIYRDLKPENILVREDGHIMLSDFDLSLRCSVRPTLIKPSSPHRELARREHDACFESPCIDPLCLQPSWPPISCFTPRLQSNASKTRKLKSDAAIGREMLLPQLVAEPNDARSNSFVGTHEYLAPEIIRGDGHGSCVDWWTYGIFIFELLFGITPFKGSGNDETLDNAVSESLKFPESPPISQPARDLIRELLVKEPENRLGFMKGATEIKQHPFFDGLNWALIRCAVPPEVPKMHGHETLPSWHLQGGKTAGGKSIGDHLKFEVF